MKLENVEDIISEIRRNGFTRSHLFLDKEEINFLNSKCKMISSCNDIIPFTELKNDNSNIYRNDFSEKTFFRTIGTNIIGVDEELDIFLNKLLSISEIKKILENFTGKNYILNNLTMRYADKNSKFVGWHQDDPNAFSLTILLNKIDDETATTAFIEGSHKFRYKFGKSLEKLNPRHFNRMSHKATGNEGEIYFFSNATVHGVDIGKASTVIICCFLPETYNNRKLNFPAKTLYDISYKIALNNELGRLCGLKSEVRKDYTDEKTTLNDQNKLSRKENVNLKTLLSYIFLVSLSVILNSLKLIYSSFKIIRP